MRKLLFAFGISLFVFPSLAQKRKLSIEALTSTFFNSHRYEQVNGEHYLYGEFRVGLGINKYLDAHVFGAIQKRSFVYYARFDNPGNLVPLYMYRWYIPVGVSLRLYLTEFFEKNLSLIKDGSKWSIYNEAGLAFLMGRDINDSRDQFFKDMGAIVPYYLVPYKEEYGNLYMTFLFGVRRNFKGKFGVFAEAGSGALMYLQFGVSARF